MDYHNFVLTNGLEIMDGPGQLAFTALIFVTAVGLYLYARSLVRRGILR